MSNSKTNKFFCSISNPKNSLRMENMWNVQMDQAWNEFIPSWNMTARIPSSSDLLITCFKKQNGKKWTQIQILSSSRANSVLCFSFGGLRSARPPASLIFFERHFWVLVFWLGNSHKFRTTAPKDFWFEPYGRKFFWIQSPSVPNDFFGLNMSGKSLQFESPLTKKMWIQVFGKSLKFRPLCA